MDTKEITTLLTSLKNGDISVDETVLKLKMKPFEDIGIASVDHHRSLRHGNPEVIYGEGKTAEQIDKIAHTLWNGGQNPIIITRMNTEAVDCFNKDIPFKYYDVAKIGLAGNMKEPKHDGYILVVTAGTSDIPVAEEAAVTAEILGNKVERMYDVGVAGIHRLLSGTDKIMKASVIIAVAGMEGALASVVGGLASCPVIAVPTSVDYGTSFGGITALLSMLNSCSSGVSVVNIDNGFGAAYQANLINNMER